jgi:hypothetical protein
MNSKFLQIDLSDQNKAWSTLETRLTRKQPQSKMT